MLSATRCLRPEATFFGRRSFWGWLNAVANKVDPDRIKDVGPDRAAAEWLLRCGAGVRWKNSQRIERDYNSLTGGKIQEIDGTDSTIMSLGFPYLKGLKDLDKIVMKKNHYLDDEALEKLSLVVDTLKHLELVSCGNVTDQGIKSLAQLKNLQKLRLFDLPSVNNGEECLQHLKSNLTKCDIDWSDFKG
jgi:H+-transporting ATP synthase F0 complex subunit s